MDLKKRILIVDDAPENIDILKALLQKDYEVLAATGGETALKISRSHHPPDLIIMDVVMPGINGIEVYRRLKEKNETATIPVIFVTGSVKNVNELEDLGELPPVLKKPLDPPLLFREVERIFAADRKNRSRAGDDA